jgi:hypothetical protein
MRVLGLASLHSASPFLVRALRVGKIACRAGSVQRPYPLRAMGNTPFVPLAMWAPRFYSLCADELG